MKKLLLSAMVLGILVCLSTPVWAEAESKSKPNYTIGVPLKVRVGQAMIAHSMSTTRFNVKDDGTIYTDGKMTTSYEVLIYNGRSGSVIRLGCGREAKYLCKPGTEFTFDLKDGKTISIFRMRIKILKVDNTGIEFVVISDTD